VSLKFAVFSVVLSVVLGHVAVFGLTRFVIVAKVLNDANLLWGPVYWITTGRLATFLLIFIGAVAGILWLRPWKAIMAMTSQPRDEDSPETLRTAVMSVLLGFLGLMGLSAATGLVAGALFNPGAEQANWLTRVNIGATLALLLLIGGGGLWGLIRLKPWARREPMSPNTRRTNALFGVSGLIATASCLAVVFHTMSRDGPGAPFSHSPVALWVAIFAIVTWLLSWAIAWLWYFSADEHEQRASDVGLLFGGLLFAVLTPAWWVAARAGLLPQPNAMVLWFAVNVIWTIGWFWRRNR
jgi:hypothetical protein